jgi:excisionase family DNA binding protein
MSIKDNYFTLSEAANELNVTRQTVFRWIKNGKITSEKVGRETLIEKAEIFRYKDTKVGEWLYQAFNFYLKKDNYGLIREHLGYSQKDKIERIGDPANLVYRVTVENGKNEMVIIKSIHVTFNSKSGHLVSTVDPKDIERLPAKEAKKKTAKNSG